MPDAGSQLFTNLQTASSLRALLDAGEAEGLLLECKAPTEPRLTRDQRAGLAKAVSGFANTAGGVILWGVSTTKHEHSGLDILTQLEPLASIAQFSRLVQNAIPTLTTPSITSAQHRAIRDKPTDTRGFLVSYIPSHTGGPVQSNQDGIFYFRSGDQFVEAPYDLIRRLFATADTPDLHLLLSSRLVTQEADGSWKIPLAVENRSNATAEHVKLYLEIETPAVCESISVTGFDSASDVNPGRTVFTKDVGGVIHRGLNTVEGTLVVKMKVAARAKRVLRFSISIFAHKMPAVKETLTVQLAKKGFSVKSTTTQPEY